MSRKVDSGEDEIKRKTGWERILKIERLGKRSWDSVIRIKYKWEKTGEVGNINQSVHLVGSHMADQHANGANLLIFSNGVQLIPLAAFISPSHTEGREVEEEEREQRRVCYDSLLLSSALSSVLFLSRSRGIKLRWWMRWTRGPEVAPAVMARGFFLGGVQQKSGKIGNRERRRGRMVEDWFSLKSFFKLITYNFVHDHLLYIF